jgi:NAD(P)-dependent dehydrogenase (short-subunit alcohol dehydrogenase family)
MSPAATSRLLEGRCAVVTGGGLGIGAGVARGLAAHGCGVVVMGTTLSVLETIAAEIRGAGGRAWAHALDVRDRRACREVAERAAADAGPISIVVNNAGVIRYARMDDPAVEAAWDDVVGTNLDGVFNVSRAFLGTLEATRGAIVNVASVAAYIHTGNTAGYSASKGAVVSLTVALARELAPRGIRVNAVAPGAIRTRMADIAGDEKKMAALRRRVPLGRIGEPEDIAGPVAFLASDLAGYITGTTVVVDGGWLTT